jgi:hypothetical protein
LDSEDGDVVLELARRKRGDELLDGAHYVRDRAASDGRQRV